VDGGGSSITDERIDIQGSVHEEGNYVSNNFNSEFDA
jgi:hypothetical protein